MMRAILTPERRWNLALLAPAIVVLVYALILPLYHLMQFSFRGSGASSGALTFSVYSDFLTDSYGHLLIGNTIRMALTVTLLALIISYPIAFALWRMKSASLRKYIMIAIFLPMLISVVVRSYGWSVLLAEQGPVNGLILWLGISDAPVKLTYNLAGVIIGLTHIFLPFMVFPIYGSLQKIDPSIDEAAKDLGAGWFFRLTRVTMPLTVAGVLSGVQLCFTLSLGAFVTPFIMGGGRVLLLPMDIYQSAINLDWSTASVENTVLITIAIIVVLIFNAALKVREG